MRIYFLLAIGLALMVTIFAVQNNEPITIQFFFWEVVGSLALVLIVTLALGVVIGLLIAAPSLLRGKLESSKQRKKVETLEAQVASASASPPSIEASAVPSSKQSKTEEEPD